MLLMLPESPYPPRCGNAIRDIQQITLLQQLGFSVRLLVVQRRGDLPEGELDFIPPGIAITYAHSPRAERESFFALLWRKIGYLLWSRSHAFAWWTSTAQPADLLVTEVKRSQPAAVVLRSIFLDLIEVLRGAYAGPIVVDCHDADVHLAAEAARSVPFWRRLGPWANLRAIRRACRFYLPLADEVWAVSEEDAERIRAQAKLRRVLVIPSAMADPGDSPAVPGDEPIATLIANYGYGPNANGARWLIEKVWPAVFKALPSARLELIGANMPAVLKQQCERTPRCTLYGPVDSLDILYGRAAVLVVPILQGGGTRLKIVEAWRRGKAVLTTSKGIEGLSAPPDCAVIADEPLLFARELLALFGNRARRLQLGNAGRAYMRSQLSYTKVLETMQSQSLLALVAAA